MWLPHPLLTEYKVLGEDQAHTGEKESGFDTDL